MLALASMADAVDRSPARLSGGESQRVAIARAGHPARSAALDEATWRAIPPPPSSKVIADLRRRGFTQALVTHEPDLGKSLADRLIELA